MVARAVSDEERIEGLKVNLTNAATAVEAFIAAFEDGVEINPESALQQLREIRGNIESVYVDLDPVNSEVHLTSQAEHLHNILNSE